MLIKDIETGTKLELEIYDNKNKKDQKTLTSQFENSEGEDCVIIHAPLYKRNIYPLHKGDLLNVFFFHEEKLYCFNGKVQERYVSNELHFVKVKVLSEITYIQRRRDYRLSCSLQINYREVELVGLQLEPKDEEFTSTIIINISGGGLCVLLSEELTVNTYLECFIALEDDLSVRFIGKIVRIEKNDENSTNYKYKAGMSYLIISDKDREAIVKFIFKEQRKLRRKGII
ncbi:MAG: hypothetical protein GYA02_10355 [Clostridiaceae bacterium]|jgi:c-di-GMP-binding flagellar brake protein YcgR|nr:hypothetical protein [Clostridiaceae bacterium]